MAVIVGRIEERLGGENVVPDIWSKFKIPTPSVKVVKMGANRVQKQP